MVIYNSNEKSPIKSKQFSAVIILAPTVKLIDTTSSLQYKYSPESFIVLFNFMFSKYS